MSEVSSAAENHQEEYAEVTPAPHLTSREQPMTYEELKRRLRPEMQQLRNIIVEYKGQTVKADTLEELNEKIGDIEDSKRPN